MYLARVTNEGDPQHFLASNISSTDTDTSVERIKDKNTDTNNLTCSNNETKYNLLFMNACSCKVIHEPWNGLGPYKIYQILWYYKQSTFDLPGPSIETVYAR